MNKSDLIDAVADAADISKMSATRTVDAVISAIGEALKAGDTVTLAGFGSFQAKVRPARTGRNPKTGEAIAIAESKVPAFKSGKALKDLLK
jgi:DNA-binding protein HU-beta